MSESSNSKAMGDKNNEQVMSKHTVEGHKMCQSRDANWLCLDKIHDHFLRPNFYDIGGTYIDEIADYWLLYKTEQVCKLYLLHLYVCNRQEGSFSLSLCNSSQMSVDERTGTVYLNSRSEVFNIESVNKTNYFYLTTYNFSELDIELMKDKKMLIAVSFNVEQKQESPNLDDIKCLHDFRQLVSDPVGTDFTIISADGAKIPVHKFLLADRSTVFKAMLKEDTAESMNSFVKINDVNKEDIECIVQFIYTGTIEGLEKKNCFNLLMLADRYDLPGLKELSQHALRQLIDTDNMLDVLLAADMYYSPALKTSALKYIKKNMSSLQTLFNQTTNVPLMQEILKYLVKRD